jgi:hypothetical protein
VAGDELADLEEDQTPEVDTAFKKTVDDQIRRMTASGFWRNSTTKEAANSNHGGLSKPSRALDIEAAFANPHDKPEGSY